jgi:DNA-binding MarR family transcriptional regulator
MKSDDYPAVEGWKLLLKFFFTQRVGLPGLAAEFELSAAQCQVLRLMEPGHPIPMSRLAETLACDRSNVTGLVDRLESRGLVCRRPSADDRRLKVLDLTPAGARLRAVVLERMTRPPEAFERLSPAEQRALIKILRRLLEQSEEK